MNRKKFNLTEYEEIKAWAVWLPDNINIDIFINDGYILLINTEPQTIDYYIRTVLINGYRKYKVAYAYPQAYRVYPETKRYNTIKEALKSIIKI